MIGCSLNLTQTLGTTEKDQNVVTFWCASKSSCGPPPLTVASREPAYIKEPEISPDNAHAIWFVPVKS